MLFSARMHQQPHKLTSVHTRHRGVADVLSYLHFTSFLLLFSFLLFFCCCLFFWKWNQMFFCCSLIWTACFVWLTLYIIYNIWGYTIIFPTAVMLLVMTTRSCDWRSWACAGVFAHLGRRCCRRHLCGNMKSVNHTNTLDELFLYLNPK